MKEFNAPLSMVDTLNAIKAIPHNAKANLLSIIILSCSEIRTGGMGLQIPHIIHRLSPGTA
jgi:hypothetical protein